jgi:uncharacterized membrane protein YadS
MHLVCPQAVEFISGISRWMLIIAIAKAGLKTNFQGLAQLGWKPVLLLVLETLYIALAAAGLMTF